MEISDLEFLIPDDPDTYFNLDIKLYIRGKLISGDGKDLNATDLTVVTNNFLHYQFSKCIVIRNSVPITQASNL